MTRPAVPLGERIALSVDETAALLGVSARFVRTLVDTGKVSVLVTSAEGRPQKPLRIMRASIEALASTTQPSEVAS